MDWIYYRSFHNGLGSSDCDKANVRRDGKHDEGLRMAEYDYYMMKFLEELEKIEKDLQEIKMELKMR